MAFLRRSMSARVPLSPLTVRRARRFAGRYLLEDPAALPRENCDLVMGAIRHGCDAVPERYDAVSQVAPHKLRCHLAGRKIEREHPGIGEIEPTGFRVNHRVIPQPRGGGYGPDHGEVCPADRLPERGPDAAAGNQNEAGDCAAAPCRCCSAREASFGRHRGHARSPGDSLDWSRGAPALRRGQLEAGGLARVSSVVRSDRGLCGCGLPVGSAWRHVTAACAGRHRPRTSPAPQLTCPGGTAQSASQSSIFKTAIWANPEPLCVTNTRRSLSA